MPVQSEGFLIDSCDGTEPTPTHNQLPRELSEATRPYAGHISLETNFRASFVIPLITQDPHRERGRYDPHHVVAAYRPVDRKTGVSLIEAAGA